MVTVMGSLFQLVMVFGTRKVSCNHFGSRALNRKVDGYGRVFCVRLAEFELTVEADIKSLK